eukprot:1643711-Prymnesium_polylepis.1
MRLGRGPRAPEQACANPLVHCRAAGHFVSVFGHRRILWHSTPGRTARQVHGRVRRPAALPAPPSRASNRM